MEGFSLPLKGKNYRKKSSGYRWNAKKNTKGKVGFDGGSYKIAGGFKHFVNGDKKLAIGKPKTAEGD